MIAVLDVLKAAMGLFCGVCLLVNMHLYEKNGGRGNLGWGIANGFLMLLMWLP